MQVHWPCFGYGRGVLTSLVNLAAAGIAEVVKRPLTYGLEPAEADAFNEHLQGMLWLNMDPLVEPQYSALHAAAVEHGSRIVPEEFKSAVESQGRRLTQSPPVHSSAASRVISRKQDLRAKQQSSKSEFQSCVVLQGRIWMTGSSKGFGETVMRCVPSLPPPFLVDSIWVQRR